MNCIQIKVDVLGNGNGMPVITIAVHYRNVFIVSD